MSNIVKQSRKVTLSGSSFTVYQKRILYEVISKCQSLFDGVRVDNPDTWPDFSKVLTKFYEIPFSNVTLEKTKNYVRVKNAVKTLDKKLSIVSDKNGKFTMCHFIDKAIVEDKENLIRIRMGASFYEELRDLSWGLSAYDLDVAKRLPSEYSMKMYERIVRYDCKDIPPLSIDELRTFFGTGINEKNGGEMKYPTTKDFLRYTLQKAKKDLDDPKYRAPYSFDYETLKEKGSIVAVKLKVYVHPEYLSNEERNYLKAKDVRISKPTYDKLQSIGWKFKPINSNLETFAEAEKYFDVPEMLDDIHKRAEEQQMDIDHEIAYTIGTLKIKLQEREPSQDS